MKVRTLAAWFAALIVFSAIPVFGQSAGGTITGTVTDQGGAVVANAMIEAKNTATGTVISAASTETGNYTLSNVPVGAYEITATVPGFKKYVRSGITVQVAQTERIDITMEVGQASDSVSVTADATMLKTETADVTHNVSVQTLNELPMLGIGAAASGSGGIRNPNNVVGIIPGTYYVPNSVVKINGAPTSSQSYRVEGQDSTTQGFPYAAAQTQPSVDAIQEVAIQTSNYAAEFGIVGGGFFNVTMRSGGNQLHGSFYDYYVNEFMNAGTPFTGAPFTTTGPPNQLVRPQARRNEYGFTVGGPITIPKIYNGKDKTFFFFSFDQFRETQIINNIPITVPTAAYRNGDFSGAIAALGNQQLKTSSGAGAVDASGKPIFAGEIFNPATARTVGGQLIYDPFVNNTIPMGQMDPVALKVQALIPMPNQPGAFNNYLPSYAAVRHLTIPSVKLDHLINDKSRLSFYWAHNLTYAPFSPIYGNSEGLPAPITASRGSFIGGHVERANYDLTLTPTLLFHLGAGFQINRFFDDAPVLDYNALTQLGLKGTPLNRNFPVFQGFCPTTPATNSCTAAGGMYGMGPAAGQTHSYWEKPSANSSVTWVHGNHNYKVGVDFFALAVPEYPFSNTAGNFSFSANQTTLPYLVGTTYANGSMGFPYASFLLGSVDSYNVAAPAGYRVKKNQVGIYAQDSWKLSRKLTFNYGLRWDYGSYFKEEHGRLASFSPTIPNPSAGNEPGAFAFEANGPDFAKNYPLAFGPRVGIAYQITQKTVFRAGFGVIYGQTGTTQTGISQAGVIATLTGTSSGQGQPAMILNNGIPVTPTWPNLNPGVLPLTPTGNATLFTGIGKFDPQAGRPPRQSQWSIGLQREISGNLVVEASYVGNVGVWWPAPTLQDVNAITPTILSHYGLDITQASTQNLLLATVGSAAAQQAGIKIPYAGFSTNQTVAQALRPFPQFGIIPVIGNPQGKTWYDSLQVKATKRLSHGLNVNGAFTWQKSLQEGVDAYLANQGPVTQGTGFFVNNVAAGPQASKSFSTYDQPFVFVVTASYALPKWGPGKGFSYVVKDWMIGTLLNYSSGLPIPTPNATTSLANQLFQPTLMNRVAGQPLYNNDLNCHCFDPVTTGVLNPAAWTNPAPGQFGNSSEYYNDFRFERHPVENLSLGRTFRFGHEGRFNLNVRAEFNNVFNRTYLNNPTATNPQAVLTRNAQGWTTGGYGYINRAVSPTLVGGQPRNGTLVARFQF